MYVFLLNYFSQQSMVDVAEECISLVTNISQQRSAKALIEASAPRVISGTFAQQKKISGSIRLAYDALAPHFSQRTCVFFPSFGFGDGFFQEVCRVALFFFFLILKALRSVLTYICRKYGMNGEPRGTGGPAT